MPKDMPWGWRHAYLNDPDGHEISLYWAEKHGSRKPHNNDQAPCRAMRRVQQPGETTLNAGYLRIVIAALMMQWLQRPSSRKRSPSMTWAKCRCCF